MSAKIDIIIVNWNSGLQVTRCVESIINSDESLVRHIIVVDNGSADDSVKFLPSHSRLKVVCANVNLGFARACNLGASYAEAKYLLFLNPDTCLQTNTLVNVYDFMESNSGKKIGICGVKNVDDNGETARHCARFPTLKTWVGKSLLLNKVFPSFFPGHFLIEFDHESSKSVDQVIGAFYFMRRDLFESLNGYDERFFVYFEDLDLALRAEKLGFKSFYLADACIYHKGGGVSEKVKAHRLFYSLRSRFLYAFKHCKISESFFIMFLAFVPEFFARLGRAFFRLSFQEFFDILKAYLWLYQSLPKTLRVALQNA